MGILLSRWRKKPSTREQLDAIQSEISAIDAFKRDTINWHKRLIGYLMAYFSLLYLLAAAVAYFRFFHHPAWQEFTSQLMLWVPFLIAPMLFLLIRKILTWWYHRKIRRNESQLSILIKKKIEILNDVMETETYKVAKEILEKYAPEKLQPVQNKIAQRTAPEKSQVVMKQGAGPRTASTPSAESELRLRVNAPRLNQSQEIVSKTPLSETRSSAVSPPVSPRQMDITRRAIASPADKSVESRIPPGPPLPRPILQRDRGYMDRMVEFLVGDGPNNRYALICKQCQSHNGMALREEFEFIGYRCCYCFYWNPARKQRPTAPKLNTSTPQTVKESESSDSSEGEEETAPQEREKPKSVNVNEERLTSKPEEERPTPEPDEKPTPKPDEKPTPKPDEKPASDEGRPTPNLAQTEKRFLDKTDINIRDTEEPPKQATSVQKFKGEEREALGRDDET